MVANSTSAALPPLCVDLDETLVKTDLLHETLLILLKRAPLSLLAIPGWFLKGRAYLKHQVALRTQMEVAQLPYRTDLIEFLRFGTGARSSVGFGHSCGSTVGRASSGALATF